MGLLPCPLTAAASASQAADTVHPETHFEVEDADDVDSDMYKPPATAAVRSLLTLTLLAPYKLEELLAP